MMTKRLILILGTLIFTGCASFSPRQAKLVGQWRFQDPALGPHTISFTHDNQFTLDYNGDNQKDIWGHYDIVLNKYIKFEDAREEMFTVCLHSGYYAFTIHNNELTFETFADTCGPRIGTLLAGWKKVTADKLYQSSK